MTSIKTTTFQEGVYTPYDCLPVADLTPAGLLRRIPEEVELFQLDKVELRSAMTEPMVDTQRAVWNDRCPDPLRLTVTTHRIVLLRTIDDARTTARSFDLEQILALTLETKLFHSPKLILTTYTGDWYLVFTSQKEREDCYAVLSKAMARKHWTSTSSTTTSSSTTRQTHKVGVDAIVSRSQQQHAHAARLTDTAFVGDMETLLREATELVRVIHKYVATLDKYQASTTDDNDDADKLVSLLSDMGMSSAWTKADFATDTAYYQQLARELADLLRPKLRGSMMTLTDVYCVYNRARSSRLLSPDDLLRAVAQLETLSVGVVPRTFPSGVRVLQDADLDPVQIATGLRELAAQKEGLTSLGACQQLHVSLVLAQEQLLLAEGMGYLVRDETLESVKFYPNCFEEFLTRYSSTTSC